MKNRPATVLFNVLDRDISLIIGRLLQKITDSKPCATQLAGGGKIGKPLSPLKLL